MTITIDATCRERVYSGFTVRVYRECSHYFWWTCVETDHTTLRCYETEDAAFEAGRVYIEG